MAAHAPLQDELAAKPGSEPGADSLLYWFGWAAFGLFLIFPILGVAYLLNLVGQPSC